MRRITKSQSVESNHRGKSPAGPDARGARPGPRPTPATAPHAGDASYGSHPVRRAAATASVRVRAPSLRIAERR
ncbi:hypothetical protein KE639_05951 [Streptomyces sp. V17-9]|nr:hypothetical protein KE639_05951 [Streptomyces sp. V17-9]